MGAWTDIAAPLGVELKVDEGMLINRSGAVTTEFGVYAVDMGTTLVTSGGYRTWTEFRKIDPDDMLDGVFVVPLGRPINDGVQGMCRAHGMTQVRVSTDNGSISPGDRLIPVAGQTYLVKADPSAQATAKVVARAAETFGNGTTTIGVIWVWFDGNNGFNVAGAAFGIPYAPRQVTEGVLVREGIVSATDWLRTGGAGVGDTWITDTPEAHIYWPGLFEPSQYEWVIEGDYQNTTPIAGGPFPCFDMDVDGAQLFGGANGIRLWNSVATTIGLGWFHFDCKITTIKSFHASVTHTVAVNGAFYNSSDSLLASASFSFMLPSTVPGATIDATQKRVLKPRLKLQFSDANTILQPRTFLARRVY